MECMARAARTSLRILLLTTALLFALPLHAQSLGRCAVLSHTGVVNTYYPGASSIAAGATSIPVGAPTGAAAAITAGDTILIIQMQDAAIDSANTGAYGDGGAGDPAQGAANLNNAGRYQYAITTSGVVGGAVTIASPTLYAFTNAAATVSQGKRSYQVIRVPTFISGALASGLTAQPWNGSTGGVLAIDVVGDLNLGGAIVDVSGLGFRGGAARQLAGGAGGSNTDYRNLATSNFHGSKGEGVAGTPRYVYMPSGGGLVNMLVEGYPNGSSARGAPGNAGGGGTDGNPSANDRNTGGGGGGNAGVGGQGGWAWIPSGAPDQTGGFGGASASMAVDRFVLGGGGGAATTNNGTGSPGGGLASSGASGGGIIMFRSGTITGSATLNARGVAGNATVTNDGSGGGGAGGSVLVYAASSGLGTLTINANGGNGGSNTGGGVAHGPGGGGGGGLIALSASATTNVAGGANGTTSTNGGNGTTYPSSYGATPGAAGVVVSGVTAAQIPGSAQATECPPIVDHFLIATGLYASTCQPHVVTITALDAAGNVFTSYTGTINTIAYEGVASRTRGTWTLLSGNGTFTAGGTGQATYTFAASDNGVVTLQLNHQGEDDLTISVEDTNVPGSVSSFGEIEFGNDAFVVTVTDQLGNVPLAGRDHAMKITRWRRNGNNCGIRTQYSGNQTLDAWVSRDASHPSGALLPSIRTSRETEQLTTVTNGGNVLFSFSNGEATFEILTTDVGKYVLDFNDGGVRGSSPTLTVRPWLHVQVPGNPGGTGPSDVLFSSAAGENFTGTVRGVLWQSEDDDDSSNGQVPNDGVPDSDANLVNNLPTERYAWLTTLSRIAPFTPSPGVQGTLTNGVIPQASFSDGAAAVADLKYSEVGSFTMQAEAASYLNTVGLNLVGTHGPVGRFRPYRFAISGMALTNRAAATCSPASVFTYMDEPLRIDFTLTAQNAGGATTQNYMGGFAKLDLADADVHGFGARDILAGVDLSGRLGVVNLTGTWDNGIADVDATVAIARAATPDGPYDGLRIGIAPVDGDGVKLDAFDLDVDGNAANDHAQIGAATGVRFGRLRLFNALGSERMPLPVRMQAEYWNGAAFVVNGADSCTTLLPSDIAMSNYQNNLAACKTAFVEPSISFANGKAIATLAAPTPVPNNGSVDLRVNLGPAAGERCTAVGVTETNATSTARSYLKGRWNDAASGAGYDDDPVARASFGIYGAQKSRRFIYSRENY